MIGASASTIMGGANKDTLVFSGQELTTSSVSGGDGADSISVGSNLTSGNTLSGGAGNDTFVFASNITGSNVSTDAGSDVLTFEDLFLIPPLISVLEKTSSLSNQH